MMKLFVSETYDELSEKAAADALEWLGDEQEALLCTASGDTPSGFYKELVKQVKEQDIDISRWKYIGLDEWMGMNGNDEGSCRYYINRQLFEPLNVKSSSLFFFDGRSIDPGKECEQAEHFIKEHGGIDVAVLGLGMNGHIGMNEPGSSLELRSHIAKLHPLTTQVGQKYFQQETVLTEGLTLGLGTLMEAKKIILLVNGIHKAAIVQKVLEGKISTDVPGSILRDHRGLYVYLDNQAASLLKHAKNE